MLSTVSLILGDDVPYVIQLLEELQKIDATIALEASFSQHLSAYHNIEHQLFSSTEGLDKSFDMLVSFGGDGTMLRAVTHVKDLGIPIVGVNTGRLGFLSTFKKQDVRKVVTEFVAGRIYH